MVRIVMANDAEKFTKSGFVKTHFLPVLLLFLIPAFSAWFFRHAERRIDQKLSQSFVRGILEDPNSTPEKKTNLVEFFQRIPMSRVMAGKNPRFDELRDSVSDSARRAYAMFRWGKRIALFCIVSALLIFVATGIGLLFSMRSQAAQYWSLSIAWHVLREYSTLQVIAQGALLVGLSYWITVMWFEIYVPKLIIVAALLAGGAVLACIKAVFVKLPDAAPLEGVLLDRSVAGPLWEEIQRIGTALGTRPPDQIFVGIDDNFFVTEHPVSVGEQRYTGRTLYLSLTLLKKLQRAETSAVLAHEMAHFSGADTTYSQKISPLLTRFGVYLHMLATNPISRPVFYFMRCIRALFEISLGKLSREREFRADRLAADQASPIGLGNALIKIAAYSKYRADVENDLFKANAAHVSLGISERVDSGFPEYARGFPGKMEIEHITTVHPFDSHPPLVQRLDAVGMRWSPEAARGVLQEPPDEYWYRSIENGQSIEAAEWDRYESRFRDVHEAQLALRLNPVNEEQRTVVLKHFPPQTLQGADGQTLVVDFEKLHFSEWPDPIAFSEVKGIESETTALGKPQLRVKFQRGETSSRTIPLKPFKSVQDNLMEVVGRYYYRHLTMVEYQKAD